MNRCHDTNKHKSLDSPRLLVLTLDQVPIHEALIMTSSFARNLYFLNACAVRLNH
jgi:hypothetical protein